LGADLERGLAGGGGGHRHSLVHRGTECHATGFWDSVGIVREPATPPGPRLKDAPGIGPLTLGGVLVEQAARVAEHEALAFDDPLRGGATARWSYADLLHHARRRARAVLGQGVGEGSRVGVLMGNRPEAVASLLGAALAGAVPVPLSTFSPKP